MHIVVDKYVLTTLLLLRPDDCDRIWYSRKRL